MWLVSLIVVPFMKKGMSEVDWRTRKGRGRIYLIENIALHRYPDDWEYRIPYIWTMPNRLHRSSSCMRFSSLLGIVPSQTCYRNKDKSKYSYIIFNDKIDGQGTRIPHPKKCRSASDRLFLGADRIGFHGANKTLSWLGSRIPSPRHISQTSTWLKQRRVVLKEWAWCCERGGERWRGKRTHTIL